MANSRVMVAAVALSDGRRRGSLLQKAYRRPKKRDEFFLARVSAQK